MRCARSVGLAAIFGYLNLKLFKLPTTIGIMLIGLLLSVFQWMCEGDSSDPRALAELRSISQSCKYLFFELGFNAGKSCVSTKKRNHYACLIDFLREHTAYENFRLLTKTRLWRGHNRFLVLCSNEPTQEDTGLRKLSRSFRI